MLFFLTRSVEQQTKEPNHVNPFTKTRAYDDRSCGWSDDTACDLLSKIKIHKNGAFRRHFSICQSVTLALTYVDFLKHRKALRSGRQQRQLIKYNELRDKQALPQKQSSECITVVGIKSYFGDKSIWCQ